MRVLTSAPFLWVFTFVIINAALVKNFGIFCTAAMTENMEKGSGIFCQLIGTVFVNALTSQTRTHPLFLVAERALDAAAIGELFRVVGISYSKTDCCA